MYKLFRKIWVSILVIIILYSFQQLKLNLVSFALLVAISGIYITHIVRLKALYHSANKKGSKDLTTFSPKEKIENNLYPLLETLIISALLNLCYFVEPKFLSIFMFTVGSCYLLYAHIIKNKEEYIFIV